MAKYYFLILSIIFALSNSCTVQKRTFNRGYFVQFNAGKFSERNTVSEKSSRGNESTLAFISQQENSSIDAIDNFDTVDLSSEDSLEYIPNNYEKIDYQDDAYVGFNSNSITKQKKAFKITKVKEEKKKEKFKKRGPVRFTNSLFLDALIQFFVALAGVCSGIILSVLSFIVFLFLNADYLPENNKEAYRKKPKTLKTVFLRAFNISFRIFFTILAYCLLALLLAYLFFTYGWLVFSLVLLAILLILLWIFSSKSSKRGMSFLFFGWGK
jgi:hypothetical protein